MIVYDIVQIVGPTTYTSLEPNSRYCVEHHDKEDKARERCELFNEKRNSRCYRYEVESHDELSPARAEWKP